MKVSYPETASLEPPEPEYASDPLLGWEEQEDAKLYRRWLETQEMKRPNWGRWPHRRFPFEIYTTLQERPLNGLGGQVFRTIYKHAHGSIVMVRAMQQGTSRMLVVKAGNRRVPVSWMWRRRLTEDEWKRIEDAARGLSFGTSLYEYLVKELNPDRDCLQEDGARISVERFDGNETRVSGGVYYWDSATPLPPSACGSEGLNESRFLAYLLTLIPCCSGTRNDCQGR